MKNTFSPIELQIILDLVDGLQGIEVEMLREKIERLKANPINLRETAKQYVADLITGVAHDKWPEPDPQRLEAARLVIEGYWGSEDEEQAPAEPDRLNENASPFKLAAIHTDPDSCPPHCDSKHAHEMMRHQAEQQKELMQASARIKDLDCSTPPEPYIRDGVTYKDRIDSEIALAEDESNLTATGPMDPKAANAVADFGPDVHGKYRVGGGPVRNYTENQEIVREEPGYQVFDCAYPLACGNPDHDHSPAKSVKITGYSGKGGPVVLDDEPKTFDRTEYEKVLNRLDPKTKELLREGSWNRPEPMTLERAVAVLDGNQYRGCFWIIDMAGTEDPPNRWALGTFTRPSTGQLTLTEFEAISVAEKLEREK